ncbi:MAG: phosphatase PAP2 family protein [Bacteroidaceae bacterium]|nr:phosphatase PAP2 family protein [Bacteroidaceae bacterium]
MRYFALILLCCLPLTLSAQAEDADTLVRVSRHEYFRPTKLILPGALLAVGAWGLENGWLRSVNRDVDGHMQDLSKGRTTKIDNFLRFAPTVGSIILQVAKVPTRYTLQERLALKATSYLAYFGLVGGLKLVVHENRPDGSDDDSFPSGHTAVVFMGAEHIRAQYGGWYGAAAYTVATGVAFLRMYNRKHWLTDVMAGAGAGILCARVGYWLLPLERKLLHLKTKSTGSSMVVLPTYDASCQAMGLAMAYQF